MLFKPFLVSLLLLVPAIAVTQEVHSGAWDDDTAIAWQCQKGSSGNIKFIIKLPDGKQYAGMFSCGTGT